MEKNIPSNGAPYQGSHPESPTGDGEGKTVLVVEDEGMVLKVVRIFLALEGFIVLVAETEDEAVEIAGGFKGKIHLLLADIRLPQGSGPGAARRIGQMRPETRIAFMSGYSRDELLDQGLISREDIFIPKPFDAKTFRRSLRNLISGDHTWTPAV